MNNTLTVAGAARLLDTYMPGWYRGIDVKTLDVSDGEKCVLAQSFDYLVSEGVIEPVNILNKYGMYDDLEDVNSFVKGKRFMESVNNYAFKPFFDAGLFSENGFRNDWICEVDLRKKESLRKSVVVKRLSSAFFTMEQVYSSVRAARYGTSDGTLDQISEVLGVASNILMGLSAELDDISFVATFKEPPQKKNDDFDPFLDADDLP